MTRRHVRAILAGALALTLLLATQPASFAQQPPPRRITSAQPLPAGTTVQAATSKRSPGRAGITARAAPADNRVSLIVQLQDPPLASYEGGLPGLAPTSPRATGATRLDTASAPSLAYLAHLTRQQDTFQAGARAAAPRAQITHRYDLVLNGLAVLVPADQVGAVASLPGVKAIYPDRLLRLETDSSPQFLGAPAVWRELGGQASAGEGVVVGVLDTGVWPEHPSLSDPDPGGKRYSPAPAPPGGSRACRFSGSDNPGPAFACNNKLIGADRFMATYEALEERLPGEFTSARDDNGHGTHTSTTAAGNRGVAADIFDIPRGTISGIAPRAHVIAYKVCGDVGCYGSDSVAAVQQAIRDGVNVINFSIGGGDDPYADAVELAFLDAYNAGLFVAASAGNDGPTAETVERRGPWVTSVAASTQSRAFLSRARLTAPGGASLTLLGASVTRGIGPRPLAVPTTDPLCLGPFEPGSLAGKIAVCQRGPGRVLKGYTVMQAGAVGMILYNPLANQTDLESDSHFLPTIHVRLAEGQALLTFIAAHPGAQASLSQSVATPTDGDALASFSSRGGPGQKLGISKPDLSAPGVQILAGNTPQSVDIATGPPGELFQAIAGTSMASPHVAGAAALLKDLHPAWTPGQIKSALMTTARTALVKEDLTTPANAFDDGSGRIRLDRADDPGLTFDQSGAGYLALKDKLWQANYPSVYFPVMVGQMTVERTAHSNLRAQTRWKLEASGPADVRIDVPDEITVPAGGNTPFKIAVDARDVPIGAVRFAQLTLTERGGRDSDRDDRGWDRDDRGRDKADRQLHIPITLVRAQPVVSLAKTCLPATIPLGGTTRCTIAATNNSFDPANVTITDRLPRQLGLVGGSLTGATRSGDTLTFRGTLAPVSPPDVTVANVPFSSPFGYVPLADFGIGPVPGVGDETLTNFTVPAFAYAGERYSALGIVSNGYVVVGGGGVADIQSINQRLPNPLQPNNVLAPFWTDLDPGTAGAVRVGVLTDNIDTWIIVEWDAVREFTLDRRDSFQIWIGVDGDTHPEQDVSFTYATLQGNGDGGRLTVGAENRFGNRGASYYFDGAGTLPNAATELRVGGAPSTPGETHTIAFDARGERPGAYVNYAEMVANLFEGTSIARFAGSVRR